MCEAETSCSVEERIELLAAAMANDILLTGSDINGKATRIALRVGDGSGNVEAEKSNGGLCEYALVNVIASSLRKRLATQWEKIVDRPEPINLCDEMLDPYNQAKQLRLQVAELEDELMQLRHARDELLQSGNKLAARLQEINSSDEAIDEWGKLYGIYG